MKEKTMANVTKARTRDAMMERDRGLVTPKEAARRSNTPLTTIYAWIHEGALEHVRVGRGRIYVALASLKRLVGPAMEARG